jgi:tetratricopeptide (TPR) repeat protein
LLRDLILTLEGLSRHYLGLKQPHEALVYSRQCAQLAEEFVALDPNDAEALEVLAVELEQVGCAHNMANQPTEAMHVLEQCVDIFHRIAMLSDDALVPWQNYAISNSNLAQSVEALGDRSRAIELLDRSIQVWARHRNQYGERADVIFNCARGSFFRSRFIIAQARSESELETRRTLLENARRDAQATRVVLDELKAKGLLTPGQVHLYGVIDGLEAECNKIAQTN